MFQELRMRLNFTGVTQLKQVNIAGLEIEEAHGGLSIQDNLLS